MEDIIHLIWRKYFSLYVIPLIRESQPTKLCSINIPSHYTHVGNKLCNARSFGWCTLRHLTMNLTMIPVPYRQTFVTDLLLNSRLFGEDGLLRGADSTVVRYKEQLLVTLKFPDVSARDWDYQCRGMSQDYHGMFNVFTLDSGFYLLRVYGGPAFDDYYSLIRPDYTDETWELTHPRILNDTPVKLLDLELFPIKWKPDEVERLPKIHGSSNDSIH